MTQPTFPEAPAPREGEEHLCVLAEREDDCFDLYKAGETFVVRSRSGEGAERAYDALPALLAGLQSFFLEFRVAAAPAKGFAELAAAQEKAKADVIDASRRIYAAIDAAK